MTRTLLAAAGLSAAVLFAASAWAHGLLVQARAEGGAVVGRVYYTDGAAGAGEFVELRDLGQAPQPVRSATTDAQGAFRFPAQAGRRYAVVAHGEEGHTTEVQLTVGEGARARLVEPTAAPQTAAFAPPAWAVIGAVLALLALPAVWLRVRSPRR